MQKILFFLVMFFACDSHAFTLKNTIGHAVYYDIFLSYSNFMETKQPGTNIIHPHASETIVLPPQITSQDIITIEFFYTDTQGQCHYSMIRTNMNKISQWPNQTLELWNNLSDDSTRARVNKILYDTTVYAPVNSALLTSKNPDLCNSVYKKVAPKAKVMPANKP